MSSRQGRRVFISHATTDRAIADLLTEVLIHGGVPAEMLFYSSARATGIPTGEDVRNQLRSHLQDAAIVIELVSPAFLRRPWCLIELGGAWVLGKSTYPIIVPPLTDAEAREQVGNVHLARLGSDSDIDNLFDELMQRLGDDCGLPLFATRWNPAVRQFKARYAALLSERSVQASVRVDRATRQDDLSDCLRRIQMRRFNSTVVVKLPGQPIWLALSTFEQHNAGENFNPLHIYGADPDAAERVPIRATVNWTEGRTLEWALERVRRVLRQTLDLRLAAEFDIDKVVERFEQEILRLY